MSHHDPFRPASAWGDSTDTDTDSESRDDQGPDHLSQMRLPDLRAMAESLGLDSTGKRSELIERIREHQTGIDVDF